MGPQPPWQVACILREALERGLGGVVAQHHSAQREPPSSKARSSRPGPSSASQLASSGARTAARKASASSEPAVGNGGGVDEGGGLGVVGDADVGSSSSASGDGVVVVGSTLAATPCDVDPRAGLTPRSGRRFSCGGYGHRGGLRAGAVDDALGTRTSRPCRLRFACTYDLLAVEQEVRMAAVEPALWGTYDEVREACDTILSSWVSAMDATLADAVEGDRLAARSYATTYVALVEFLSTRLPTASREQYWLARVARREAIALPFRSCLVEDRPGLSVALTLVSDIRRMSTATDELAWPSPCVVRLSSRFKMDDRGVREFERIVDAIVDGAVSPLEEAIEAFDLSLTDAGRLFGVTRQAVSQWLTEGVPADRQAKVTSVAQVASLLRHYLVPERIPGIARKPADAYGGRSMLGMIEDDDHLALLDITRRSFDWASTA